MVETLIAPPLPENAMASLMGKDQSRCMDTETSIALTVETSYAAEAATKSVGTC